MYQSLSMPSVAIHTFDVTGSKVQLLIDLATLLIVLLGKHWPSPGSKPSIMIMLLAFHLSFM